MTDKLSYQDLLADIKPLPRPDGTTHSLPAETFDQFTLNSGLGPFLDALSGYVTSLHRGNESDNVPIEFGVLFYKLGIDGIIDISATAHRRNVFYAVLAIASAAKELGTHISVQRVPSTPSENLCRSLVYLGNLTRGMGHNKNITDLTNKHKSGIDWRKVCGLSNFDFENTDGNIGKDNAAHQVFTLINQLKQYWDHSSGKMESPEVPSYLSDPAFVLTVAEQILKLQKTNTHRLVQVPFGAYDKNSGSGYSFAFTLNPVGEMTEADPPVEPQVVLDPASCYLFLTDTSTPHPPDTAENQALQSNGDTQDSFAQVLNRIPQAVFNGLPKEARSRALQHRWALGIELLTHDAPPPTTLEGASATMAATTLFACAWMGTLHDDRVAVLGEIEVNDDGLTAKAVDDKGLEIKIEALIRDTCMDTVLIHADNAATAESVRKNAISKGRIDIKIEILDANDPLGIKDV